MEEDRLSLDDWLTGASPPWWGGGPGVHRSHAPGPATRMQIKTDNPPELHEGGKHNIQNLESAMTPLDREENPAAAVVVRGCVSHLETGPRCRGLPTVVKDKYYCCRFPGPF
ncbi:hypothetical protein NDU88_002556 [Pleurodeles waltl]|uniref:Uncharacterized protein n=1 Tax=Pleurodeles waltl TaxID=8319 RepID=A0AAV7WQA2_PLEWA|nr:hypothetical protein NDU88_002556 [Pleurodeles waltl]